MKISAVIIAKDEEKDIKDCLESVRWADEVVVIDTGSKDKTIEIARKFSAKVVEYKEGKNYSDWRNKGAKEAKGEWILYVDADERVTPELRSEIESGIRNNELWMSTYAIPRKNFIFGKEFKHGGQWPDYQKRLFKRSELQSWKNELHEEPVYSGDLGHLKNPLIHLKEDNLYDMVEKTNLWSEVEGKTMYQAGHPKMNVFRFATAGAREFWLRFVRQLAFLDGTEGIIYGLYQVYSRLISYAKLWELQIRDTKYEIRNTK